MAQRFDQGWTCQCCTDHDSIVNASMTSAAVELPVRILASEDMDGLWDKLSDEEAAAIVRKEGAPRARAADFLPRSR